MPFDGIGAGLVKMVASAAEALLTAIWTVSVLMLRKTFEIIDVLMGSFDGAGLADAAGNPGPALVIGGVWPTLRWIGGVVALGLFFWQLSVTVLKGGTGFWRLASGPVAYALATALTLGAVAGLLGAAEGLTSVLLTNGLNAATFSATLTNPNVPFVENPALEAEITDGTVRAVLLGLIGLFGLIPASIGYALEMIFRQAAIVVLLATVPITAAGLLTNTTAAWFWKSLRWIVAAVLLKPAVALVLVVGVNMLSQPSTVGGLIAGAAVLLLGIFCPFALFRLLAFVDPGTNAGAAARSSFGSAGGGMTAEGSGAGPEAANMARFDAASGAAASGGATAGGGAAAGGGVAAGAAGAATGGMALAAMAVKNAASSAVNYANSAMDASGIGQGYGGAPIPIRSGPAGAGSSGSGSRSGISGVPDGQDVPPTEPAPAGTDLDTSPPDHHSGGGAADQDMAPPNGGSSDTAEFDSDTPEQPPGAAAGRRPSRPRPSGGGLIGGGSTGGAGAG